MEMRSALTLSKIMLGILKILDMLNISKIFTGYASNGNCVAVHCNNTFGERADSNFLTFPRRTMDTAVGILSWPLGLFTNGNQDCLMVELVLLTNLCLLDYSLIYLRGRQYMPPTL
jgi:hypothetical protein